MTGYGRGSHTGDKFLVQFEVRSVNHRFRDIVVKVPSNMLGLVEPIRNRIAGVVARGRVEAHLSLEALPRSRRLKVDTDLATTYWHALEDLRRHLRLADPITLDHILRFGDIFIEETLSTNIDDVWSDVEPAVTMALDNLLAMRDQEGQALYQDFQQRLDQLDQYLESIAARAPLVVDEYRLRLQERVKELLPNGDLDEARLMAEVVLFAERSDINEELVRLRSHLDQLRRVLDDEGAIGRKVEFLLQEIHREVNTTGAKSHDLDITVAVMAMKTELEKLREQAQNVE